MNVDQSLRGDMSDRPQPRLRIAWGEEWMSSLASHVLPYLAQKHEIIYVTSGDRIPQAQFHRVIRVKRWKYMYIAGFELSWRVNRLYREGLIDLAVVWSSIGFGLRRVPFINLEGGSVYAEILLFGAQMAFYKRIKFFPGFLHYAVPEMLCNRRAAEVIVPSNFLKHDLIRLHNLPDHKVAVVPHGVEARHMALYQRKLPHPCTRILFVGRLHFRKGIGPVLTEFVRRRDINAEFVIVGDGPDRANMEKTAAGDGRVKILGFLDPKDLEAIFLTTNVFVFPTFYEGFGLALVEAMATGHACVCYDIPVVREVLGDCGVYVSVGDTAGLVNEVGRLVESPDTIETYSARAHERAGKFSWDDAKVAIDNIIRDTAFQCKRKKEE